MCCPARPGLIGVANNYVHSWRFFTSQLWRHNCIIIFESASATAACTKWSTRGWSVNPLRFTWLINMFTYFAGRCFAYEPQRFVTCTCFVQTCIITAAKGEPLTDESPRAHSMGYPNTLKSDRCSDLPFYAPYQNLISLVTTTKVG